METKKFDFNLVQVLLDLTEFKESDKKAILDDYYRLLNLKLIEVANLTDKDIDKIPEGYINEKVFTTTLLKKLQEDPNKLDDFNSYVFQLNKKFFYIIIKMANDEEKRKIMEYLDQYEENLVNLSQELSKLEAEIEQ